MQLIDNQVNTNSTLSLISCVWGCFRLWAGCVLHNQTQPGCGIAQPHNRKNDLSCVFNYLIIN